MERLGRKEGNFCKSSRNAVFFIFRVFGWDLLFPPTTFSNTGKRFIDARSFCPVALAAGRPFQPQGDDGRTFREYGVFLHSILCEDRGSSRYIKLT
jgi:hypothetical protein